MLECVTRYTTSYWACWWSKIWVKTILATRFYTQNYITSLTGVWRILLKSYMPTNPTWKFVENLIYATKFVADFIIDIPINKLTPSSCIVTYGTQCPKEVSWTHGQVAVMHSCEVESVNASNHAIKLCALVIEASSTSLYCILVILLFLLVHLHYFLIFLFFS